MEPYLTFDVISVRYKDKERHWWRHNGDSDHRPLSLPLRYDLVSLCLLSGVPDYFDRNKISSGGDLSHYSSASLY